MLKVGILSDTHGYFNPLLYKFFKDCDELWHAGDWGAPEMMDEIRNFKPVRGVHGNIDGREVRSLYPAFSLFQVEEFKVGMHHWGGYPGKYSPEARTWLKEHRPGIFITGHSHILRVMRDTKQGFMFFNPGAAGNVGFHQVCTAIRLKIDGPKMTELEVWELPRKA